MDSEPEKNSKLPILVIATTILLDSLSLINNSEHTRKY